MQKPASARAGYLRSLLESATEAGIHVTLNLIFGYPGEEENHRQETLRVMSEIGELYSNVTFSPKRVHSPYPGIPIWLRTGQKLRPGRAKIAGGLGRDGIWGAAQLCPGSLARRLMRLQRAMKYFLMDIGVNRARIRARSAVVQSVLKIAPASSGAGASVTTYMDIRWSLWLGMAPAMGRNAPIVDHGRAFGGGIQSLPSSAKRVITPRSVETSRGESKTYSLVSHPFFIPPELDYGQEPGSPNVGQAA